MADDENVEVSVEETAPEQEEVTAKVEETEVKAQETEKEETPAIDPEALKRVEESVEKERQLRLAAERRYRAALTERDRAAQEAQVARHELNQGRVANVNTGLEAAEAAASAAETQYKAAFEAGDVAAMAKAQRQMARAEADLGYLRRVQTELEASGAVPQPQTGAVQETDPIEAFIAGRTPPTANWLRAHKEWLSDPRKNSKLQAAHFSAVGDGITPDSQEYFEAVETFLGLRTPPETKTTTNGASRPRKSAPAAPVQASSGGAAGNSGNEVRLTKGEAERATDGTLRWNYDDPSGKKRFKKGDPIGINEYARRKLVMQKRGDYDRSFTDQ